MLVPEPHRRKKRPAAMRAAQAPALHLIPSYYNQIGLGFVLCELDLAVTFCEVGLATRDISCAERNADNARVALQVVSQVKERLSLNKQAKELIISKTSRVASLLVQLERRLTSAT